MSTQSDEVTTDTTAEQIAANIERIRSLAEAENIEGVADLVNETEALIAGIKGAGSVARKKALREEMAEAAAAQPSRAVEVSTVVEGVVALETQDYTKVAGVPELISKGAKDLAEGVQLHIKAADTARNTAEVLLEMRLKMQNKEGTPDLAAKSNAAKQAAQAMYNAVREGGSLEDTYENRDAVKKLMRAVQYQMSDVVVKYVRSLDENPDEAAKFAKAIAAAPAEVTAADAVFAFYGINRESQAEIAVRREAEKRALAAGAQSAAVANPAEGDEDEGEGEGDNGTAAEVNPDEYAKALSHKFAKVSKGVNVHLIEAASDDIKAEVRGDLEDQLAIIKNLIAATL